MAALDWLRHYRRAWLGGDVVAALTTWALVVPQAIAYAQIAVNLWTVAIGLGSLAVLLGLKRVAPGVPAALLVVVGGIAVVAAADLTARGVEVIGAVDGAVPLPAVPRVGWDELVGLLPGAIAVAIIGYAESATVAESMANEHGYDVEPDRELRATGIANILSGLFQGFITGGGGQPVGRQRPGRGQHPAGVAARVGPDGGHRRGPAAAVPGPAPGGPGRRGHQRRDRLPRPGRPGAGAAAAPRQLRDRRRGHAGRAGPGRAPGADRGRGHLPGGVPGPGQPAQRLGARPDPGHGRVRGPGARPGGRDRAGAARLPAERAAAVRQRQAAARRDPGPGARRRPPGPGGPARPVVHPELDIESVNVLASLRHELDGRGVALWLAGVRAIVEDLLVRSGLADAIGRDHLYREVEDAAGDASA